MQFPRRLVPMRSYPFQADNQHVAQSQEVEGTTWLREERSESTAKASA